MIVTRGGKAPALCRRGRAGDGAHGRRRDGDPLLGDDQVSRL
jgi:hypothetical protein